MEYTHKKKEEIQLEERNWILVNNIAFVPTGLYGIKTSMKTSFS